MYFGMPHSAGLGPIQNAVLWQRITLADDNSYFELEAKPSPGMGDAYFGIYVNGAHAGTAWLAEGVASSSSWTVPWGSNSFSYLLMRHGHSADSSYSDDGQARFVEQEGGSKRATLEFTFVPEAMGDVGDISSSMSAWTFSGLSQGANCDHVQGFPARGRLTADLAVAGSTATLELSCGGQVVATGTATLSGATTLSFSESNSSGLSGSVLVSGSATTVSGISVYVRWPASMVVYRSTSSPPSAEVARATFAGVGSARWTEPRDMAPNVYYYRLRPYSDTGEYGAFTATMGLNMDAVPSPPSHLRYVSGDVSNTILAYSGSSTAGATYRLYSQSKPSDLINLLVPDDTAPTGTLAMSLPLDHITGFSGIVDGFSGFSGFSGQIYAMVRAVHPASGVEERNMDGILLEYDQFGRHVAKRPNPARLDPLSLSVASGLTATIEATYDDHREEGTATSIKLYVRTETGTYDFESPATSSAITTGSDMVKYANLTYVAPSAGFYYFKALAWTASGGSSVDADCNEALAYVSDVDMPAPTGFSAYASS